MGTLSIIGTPIGNLEDVTVRALATIRQVDLLLCEDTRVTKRLLDRYEITVTTESYREEVHFQKVGRIVELLRQDKHVGLVSDAGTPGISDPGSRLVRDVLAAEPSVKVVPIPGPSAVTTALSASGFPSDAFVFLGFPPHKKGRASFFTKAMSQELTTVLYESTHRIDKALASIAEADPQRKLCVARELTKMFETFYRGTADEIIEKMKSTSSKGEFVIIIPAKA